MIIAIDGPAGSGKSSTAKALARQLGFAHLDSGAFYRAITFAALEQRIDPARWADLRSADLDDLHVRAQAAAQGFEFFIGDENITQAIRSSEVNAHVSQMAAVATVREWLMDQLRAAARSGNLVADGRDIGTVVFPHADLKVFLVARPKERARRRLAETGSHDPSDADVEAEEGRLSERDRVDSSRATAPLRQAEDAVVIDTTDLSFEEQVERIAELARLRMSKS